VADVEEELLEDAQTKKEAQKEEDVNKKLIYKILINKYNIKHKLDYYYINYYFEKWQQLQRLLKTIP
jgi:hypothetical protein